MVDYKKEVEKMIQELKQENPDREVKFKDNYILSINGMEMKVSILDIKEPMEKDDEKTNINKMQILFKTKDGYVLIAEVTPDNEIIINSEGIKKAGLEGKILLTGSDKIGLREDEEKQRDIADQENGDQEKADEEKPEKSEELEENKREEEEKDDKKPELNKKQSNWIKLDLSAQVVYNKTLAQILPNAHKYKEVYVAPGKDQFSYSLVGGDEQNGYEPIEGLEKTEGSNPTQKISAIQNQGKMDVKSEQSFAMFKIKGRESEGFSINLAQSGNSQIEVSYWRKSYGDNYISIPIAQETADRGYNEHSPEARYFMARSTHSNWGMDDRIDDSEDIERISAKLPSEINPASDGIQLEELDKQTFREKLIEKIMKDVMGEGMQHPDYERAVREKATTMADKIIIDGMDPDLAKEEVFGPKRESGGLTPDQKRNREG